MSNHLTDANGQIARDQVEALFDRIRGKRFALSPPPVVHPSYVEECATCEGTGDGAKVLDGQYPYSICPDCTGTGKQPLQDGEV